MSKHEKAFAEWDRRYREEPAAFEADFARIIRGQSAYEYGQAAAAYFKKLLAETAKY